MVPYSDAHSKKQSTLGSKLDFSATVTDSVRIKRQLGGTEYPQQQKKLDFFSEILKLGFRNPGSVDPQIATHPDDRHRELKARAAKKE